MKTLQQVGRQVRRWAVNKALEHSSVYTEELSGLCVLASVRAIQLLADRRVCAGLAWYDSALTDADHCFVVSQGWVLDVTATQFNSAIHPVVVAPWAALKRQAPFWRAQYVFSTPQLALSALRRAGWPPPQLALPRPLGKLPGRQIRHGRVPF